jgi:hypothetical protein
MQVAPDADHDLRVIDGDRALGALTRRATLGAESFGDPCTLWSTASLFELDSLADLRA